MDLVRYYNNIGKYTKLCDNWANKKSRFVVKAGPTGPEAEETFMEAAELGEKTGRLARRIAELGFDAVLLNSQHNFAWLTGGGINGVDASTVNGVVSLLVTREGQRFLLANEIEMPRMLAEEVSSRDFAPAAFPWT